MYPLEGAIFRYCSECTQYTIKGRGESGNEGVRNGGDCDRLDGGTFNNQKGREALMECKGGGRGGEDDDD